MTVLLVMKLFIYISPDFEELAQCFVGTYLSSTVAMDFPEEEPMDITTTAEQDRGPALVVQFMV